MIHYDYIVEFSQVQALLGGRVTLMISGSAPLSLDTQKFIQTVFNCPLRQGCVAAPGPDGRGGRGDWGGGRQPPPLS